MKRRSFLQVMGLAVAAPSFLVTEKDSPPKRQNPDFITTGFESIDDVLGGGFNRGSFNVVFGHKNQPIQTRLLMKSIAIKAASDLSQRSSVLMISPPQNHESIQSTRFDGLLTTSQFLDWNSIGNYDLVIIDRDQNENENWILKNENENWILSRKLSRLAHDTNTAIVQRNPLFRNNSMYFATTALMIKNHSETYRLPELEILKNRYGHLTSIDLIRPSVHFYEEAGKLSQLHI